MSAAAAEAPLDSDAMVRGADHVLVALVTDAWPRAVTLTDGNNDVAWADLDVFGPFVLAVTFCSMSGGVRFDSDTLIDTTGPTW